MGEWEIPRIPLQYKRAVLAHQQAAMPEQLLAHPAAEIEHDDHEPAAAPRHAIDMRLRCLEGTFTAAADRARTTLDRSRNRNDAEASHPVREDDQRLRRPQDAAPHRDREAGY
ncbi:hypothetical protein [Streptomyces sp. NPDC006552]|uniref:hypothetical protein n=1 Tax=Streptomyces sp. NPDC006552 TaxID=3157179 RepID=UPI0033A25616